MKNPMTGHHYGWTRKTGDSRGRSFAVGLVHGRHETWLVVFIPQQIRERGVKGFILGVQKYGVSSVVDRRPLEMGLGLRVNSLNVRLTVS